MMRGEKGGPDVFGERRDPGRIMMPSLETVVVVEWGMLKWRVGSGKHQRYHSMLEKYVRNAKKRKKRLVTNFENTSLRDFGQTRISKCSKVVVYSMCIHALLFSALVF